MKKKSLIPVWVHKWGCKTIWCHHSSYGLDCVLQTKWSKEGDAEEFEQTAGNIFGVNKHLLKKGNGMWSTFKSNHFTKKKQQFKQIIGVRAEEMTRINKEQLHQHFAQVIITNIADYLRDLIRK